MDVKINFIFLLLILSAKGMLEPDCEGELNASDGMVVDLRYYIPTEDKTIPSFHAIGATKLLSGRKLKLGQRESLPLDTEKMLGEQKMR